jgi:hypothetical protein
MQPWLNTKMAGLPRWAWLALLAGGVGVGLYLRSLNQETEGEGDEETEELPSSGSNPQSMESMEGETGGGLQALGVAGPTPQATVPVETPYLPEGIDNVLAGQQDTTQSLANGVLESNIAAQELAGILAERGPQKEIIREKMVGHPPKRKPHHKPPRSKPKNKKKHKKKTHK